MAPKRSLKDPTQYVARLQARKGSTSTVLDPADGLADWTANSGQRPGRHGR